VNTVKDLKRIVTSRFPIDPDKLDFVKIGGKTYAYYVDYAGKLGKMEISDRSLSEVERNEELSAIIWTNIHSVVNRMFNTF
jgi:hypothetical protein